MSGAKRRTPYRKKVTAGVLDALPEPGEGQRIAIVQRSHGSNLLEVAVVTAAPAGGSAVSGGGAGADGLAAATTGLAMLPTKFRKLVWVKRGDPVIVSEAAGEYDTAAGGAGRVRFIIDHVLYADQVKHLRTIGKWEAGLDDLIAACGGCGVAGGVGATAAKTGGLSVKSGAGGGARLAGAAAAAAARAGGGAAAAPGGGGVDDGSAGNEDGEEGSDDSEDEGTTTERWMARHRGGPRDLPPSDDDEESDGEADGDGEPAPAVAAPAVAAPAVAADAAPAADAGGDGAATAAAAGVR